LQWTVLSHTELLVCASIGGAVTGDPYSVCDALLVIRPGTVPMCCADWEVTSDPTTQCAVLGHQKALPALEPFQMTCVSSDVT